MEEELNGSEPDQEIRTNPQKRSEYLIPASIIVGILILAGVWIYTAGLKTRLPILSTTSRTGSVAQNGIDGDGTSADPSGGHNPTAQKSGERIFPDEIILPIKWGDLGVKMAGVGVIDRQKFKELYVSRGGLDADARKMLDESDVGEVKMTSANSGVILNMFWALGLGNKNRVLETGPMSDPVYGGAGNFASTGGWTLAQGDATMEHYSRHPFIVLTPEQQLLVEKVSQNIYRPCCDNPTHFPDCNHGMAMLGLLELLAERGVTEAEMYKIALQVNSAWFLDQYLTIAGYLKSKGIAWSKADPKIVLGRDLSSASGFRRISALTPPGERQKNSGGCGA